MVRLYILQKGEIQVWDKVVGRHDNKAVISQIYSSYVRYALLLPNLYVLTEVVTPLTIAEGPTKNVNPLFFHP
jgi:hypothetical protein